jgi:hypothetical protein
MCMHLQKTLDYLSAFHGLKVVSKVNGKGWGVGYLIGGDIPFKQVIKDRQVDSGVGVFEEEGIISCRVCWENIAEYSRYEGKWG